jgi:hypothetical protein
MHDLFYARPQKRYSTSSADKLRNFEICRAKEIIYTLNYTFNNLFINFLLINKVLCIGLHGDKT